MGAVSRLRPRNNNLNISGDFGKISVTFRSKFGWNYLWHQILTPFPPAPKTRASLRLKA
jgi:hypothetical protein